MGPSLSVYFSILYSAEIVQSAQAGRCIYIDALVISSNMQQAPRLAVYETENGGEALITSRADVSQKETIGYAELRSAAFLVLSHASRCVGPCAPLALRLDCHRRDKGYPPRFAAAGQERHRDCKKPTAESG